MTSLTGTNAVPLEDPRARPHAAARERADSTIHTRFFRAAIVVVLTAGAAWGATLLWRIGLAGSFTAISIHDVNAHGHAQIFGWVGLMVMGFAYAVFPRLSGTTLWRPELARLTLWLILAGIAARVLGEPLHAVPGLRALALAGAAVEIAAIGLFAFILLKTLQTRAAPLQWHHAYVAAGVLFFVAQSIYELLLLAATTGAPSRAALLNLIATWQAPLRDMQIHGFALLLILGVGTRLFPEWFALQRPGRRLVRNGFFVLVAAILGEMASFLLMRTTGNHAWAGGLYLCVLLLAGTVLLITLRWGLLARAPLPDPSTKFIRFGVAWLHTSLFMLVLAPLYMFVLLPNASALSPSGIRATEIHFSHAYYGAIRHAITVGFISLTIMGMAAKVVPALQGRATRGLPPLWLPFVLMNVGCLLRVSLQVATDLAQPAYLLVGVSGVLEVTGLALWGIHLWRLMRAAPTTDAGELGAGSTKGTAAARDRAAIRPLPVRAGA